MADNTTLNAGSGGDVIASDDIAGVKHQQVKVEFGADGTATPVSTTNPLPVNNAQLSGTTIVAASAGVQKVGISDSLGQSMNSAATGFLKVSDEPRQLFYDSFDAALDTTNMWTSTQGSSGVAAAVALGVLSMGTGTVASGYSKLTSIPTFKPTIPGWVVYSDAIQIPDAAAPTANALRLWGVGTTPATPTAAAPITDGYFFELSTAGVLSAVVYAGGTRTVIATGLTLATTYQRYIIQVRTDRTFFFIGTIDSAGLVATTNFQSPQSQILPKLYLAVGGTTPPASNSQILSTGAVVSDTGKNTTQISDGTYPWRRAQVNSLGAVSVAPLQKATYRASTTAVLVAAVTSPNPFFTIYGSATKTIRIQSIVISGLTLTAVAYLNIGLKKYSTAVTGGTSTALTQVPVDANNAAGSATNVNAYTAIPTAGTAIGDLTSRRVLGQATTAAAAGIPQVIDFDFTTGDGQPVTLRGTAQGIGLYWITAPASTVSMLIRVEYTED